MVEQKLVACPCCMAKESKQVFDYEKHENICTNCGLITNTRDYYKVVRAIARFMNNRYGAGETFQLCKDVIDSGVWMTTRKKKEAAKPAAPSQ